MLADGRVSVTQLVEARYGLDDVEAAFEHAGRRGVRKILVRTS